MRWSTVGCVTQVIRLYQNLNDTWQGRRDYGGMFASLKISGRRDWRLRNRDRSANAIYNDLDDHLLTVRRRLSGQDASVRGMGRGLQT